MPFRGKFARAREGLSRVHTSFGGAVGVRTTVRCQVSAISGTCVLGRCVTIPQCCAAVLDHHKEVISPPSMECSTPAHQHGSRKSPRWRLPLGQPSCLARGSDLQRRSRRQVVEDELRSCWSTEVHTAARTPHPPTTQPPHDARAFSTDHARAAPPQGRSRSRTGRAGTAARGRRRQRAASQTQLAIAAATWPGYPRPHGQNMMTESGCACVNSQM